MRSKKHEKTRISSTYTRDDMRVLNMKRKLNKQPFLSHYHLPKSPPPRKKSMETIVQWRKFIFFAFKWQCNRPAKPTAKYTVSCPWSTRHCMPSFCLGGVLITYAIIRFDFLYHAIHFCAPMLPKLVLWYILCRGGTKGDYIGSITRASHPVIGKVCNSS